MISWKIGIVAVAVAALALILLPLHAARASAPAAIRYQGTSAVGALAILKPNGSISHVRCTGSVLKSPAGNLILTAAHCLGRVPPTAMAFIPDYRHGSRSYPDGLWRVTGQVLPADWLPSRNVNSDFAFLTVNGDVQAKAGAETLGASSPVPASVQVIAYTSPGYPVTCTRPPTTITVSGQQQLEFACGGYASGSSGAPFLANVNARTGNGTVIGVLGGYQKGGRAPSVSYSSPFGTSVRAFYEAVILAQRADGGG